MGVSENQSSPLSLKGGNLNIEEHSDLQVQFPKELCIVDERKNNNSNANMKDMYVNAQSCTSNSVEEGLNADSMGVSIDMVYLENLPVEDLQHDFEVVLHIDGVQKEDCNSYQSQIVVLLSSKDEKNEEDKGSPRTPKLNSTVSDEQSIMEQKKPSLDSAELVMYQNLSKSATFPCSVPPTDKSNEEAEKTDHAIVDVDQPLESKDTTYSQTCSLPSSFKIISAMRGGHEQNGLGPRPKLSVKWAPDVQEPQVSSVSHTVKNHRWHQSKKKDRKHKHKGKSSHTSGSNKSDKKHHSKRSYNSESGRSRLWSSSYEKRMLLDVWAPRNSMLVLDKNIGWETPMFNMKMEEDDVLLNMPSKHSSGKGHSDFLLKGSSDAEFPSQGFKCASHFGHTLQSKHISYAEAA